MFARCTCTANECVIGDKAFRGKRVVKLHAGGATSFSHDKKFVLLHLPDVAHGGNENFTWLYHLLRWELWHPDTKAAGTLYIDWDGGSENTTSTSLCFWSHLIAKGWKTRIETHRMVRSHTHNGQDQEFYILRYCGWKTSLYVTSLAQGLFNLLRGFVKHKDKYVMLLLASNYDWASYFDGCHNPNWNYRVATQPLGWQYCKPEPSTYGLPAVRVKTWGDAQQRFNGERDQPNAPPLIPYVGPPGISFPYCNLVALLIFLPS